MIEMVLPYRYRADIENVVDGDTVDLTVDLGMHILVEDRFRVFGIDAWETRGDERERGLVAKDYVATWMILNGEWPLIVDTHKDTQGKYGRWLATIWKQVDNEATALPAWTDRGGTEHPATVDSHWVSLADDLVAHGHAELRDYS